MRIVLLGIALALGCADELSDARARWARAGSITNEYAYRYETTGFVGSVGALDVCVRENAVVQVACVDTGTECSATVENGSTIPQLFDVIEARTERAKKVRATYDQELGQPLSVFFDNGEEGDGFDTSDLSFASCQTVL